MLIAVALVLGTNVGWADVITINNYDFSTGNNNGLGGTAGTPSGWSGSSGTVGIYSPSSSQYTAYVTPNNMAYVGGTGDFYQNLNSLTLTANEQLQLTLTVGLRKDHAANSAGAPYVNLYESTTSTFGSGTLLTPTVISEVTPTAQGDLESWKIDYTVSAGQSLQILLGDVGGTEVDFDNVTFSPVPEKENEALTFFGIIAVGGIAGSRFAVSKKLKFNSLKQR
jgi:hypothetical protein